MKIRAGTIEDAAAISQLVYSLSEKYIAIDFDHEGASNLLASMETTAIERYLTSDFRYHIAEENGIIIGVVGVRESKHLYHLFVTETRQKQGLATELWRVAREACIAAGNPREFTVNSSRCGLPFYAKLGFVQIGDPENRGGVIAIPMKLTENEPKTHHPSGPAADMADDEADWDRVYRKSFESAAFWDVHWIRKARDLYETARSLEPHIAQLWESYRARFKGEPGALKADHYQGSYFMLLAFATENLLKAAAVAKNGHRYKTEFRTNRKFPEELKKHNLVELAKIVELAFTHEEEDLLRRLTRSAIWYGRYPVPLYYEDMSANERFSNGNEYTVSWFGGNDINRLNAFINSLPGRLGLHERHWDHTA